jgi:hypothetical protein
MFYDNSSQNILSLAGALYDIAGAFPLARALIFVKARDLYGQAAAPYSGPSALLLKMFAEQKVDASFGLFSLFVGFGLQALASLGVHPTLQSIYGRVLLIVLMVILATGLVAYGAFRYSLTHRFFREAGRAAGRSENDIADLWSRAQQQKEN